MLSKRGLCSRSQAAELVRAGRVQVDGRVVTDPESPTDLARARIRVEGLQAPAERIHIALNKPRGLVTSRADERGRDTVYACLADAGLPWLAPVGRLDRASEGLLLLCNDPQWAAAISAAGGIAKVYHVQVGGTVPEPVLAALRAGVDDAGERLVAARVAPLRSGGRTTWLEFELRGGRNRQIRRMLAAHGLEVKRLIRIAIGDLVLGELPKGAWRHLTPGEVASLRPQRMVGPKR